MTINDIRAMITTRLLNLGLIVNGVEIDGEKYDPKTTDTWVRLSVRFNAGAITTLGGEGVSRRRDRIGIAYVNVFTPMQQGVFPNDELCEQLVQAFEGQWADPCINYGQPTGVRIETEGRDDEWYLQTVVVPFTAEVVR